MPYRPAPAGGPLHFGNPPVENPPVPQVGRDNPLLGGEHVGVVVVQRGHQVDNVGGAFLKAGQLVS
jgi:hypothetical protein